MAFTYQNSITVQPPNYWKLSLLGYCHCCRFFDFLQKQCDKTRLLLPELPVQEALPCPFCTSAFDHKSNSLQSSYDSCAHNDFSGASGSSDRSSRWPCNSKSLVSRAYDWRQSHVSWPYDFRSCEPGDTRVSEAGGTKLGTFSEIPTNQLTFYKKVAEGMGFEPTIRG